MKTPYINGYENIGWISLFCWLIGENILPGEVKYRVRWFEAEKRLHWERTGHYGRGSACVICGTGEFKREAKL